MPIEEGAGSVAPGLKTPYTARTWEEATQPQTISNQSGDGNSYQGVAGQLSGGVGGLAANVFQTSKEFTTLPTRFGTMYKSSAQQLASGVWTVVLGYDQVAEFGIHPDAPSGVLSFGGMPPTAWVQIYGWLEFLVDATGMRYGRLVDNASGNQLMSGAEGQAGNAVWDTLFSWCSLPYNVVNLPAGVRLEAYQSKGSSLALVAAALWAKRVY